MEYALILPRILELSFNPIVSDGKITGISVFGKDITERKTAEKTLQEAENKYKGIFDGALEGMFQTSPDSRFLTANRALAEMLGYASPDELISAHTNPARDLWADQAELSELMRQLEEHGSVRGFECRLKRKGGAVLWVALSARRICGADEQPLCLEGFIADITERKRAEMQLRDSEERFRESFEQAAVGIVHVTFAGRILRCNARFAQVIGYPLEEIPGMTFRQITAPEFLDESEAALRHLAEAECGTPSWEKCYIRKDGSMNWVRLTSSVQRDGEGRALHIVTFVEDINARKLTEMQLHDSEERYRTVFQTGPDAAIIARLSDGMIIDANQAFLDSSGHERHEVMGRTTLELGIWVNAEDRKNLIDAVLQNNTCQNFEVLSRRKSGEIFWMRLSASSIEIRGERCLLAFARDISGAKAAEERLAAAAEELRASEERYRATFQMSIDAVNINRLSDGVFVDVNDAFLDFVGYRREEVIGRTSEELNFWVDRDVRQKMVETLRQNASCRNLEARFRRKNGEIVWGQLSESLIATDGVACILSVTRDITGAKAAQQSLATAQQALRASEERYRTAFQTSMDAITISSFSDGKYFDVNKAFLDLIGYEYWEVVGRTSIELGIWAHPGAREEMAQMLRQNLSFRDVKTQFIHKKGEIRWVMMSASITEIEGVPCILSVMRDISEAKAAEEKINDLAFYDPLTRLPNRRLLLERVRHSPAAMARTHRMRALLFIDLDNFKMLNDTLGHQTGDLLLQEVARRLASCVRQADTVARLSGDEFVVMLENLSKVSEHAMAQAKTVGEKILAVIGQPHLFAGHEYHCTACVGITVFGEESESAVDVLQRAEIAMFQAKEAGRNTMRFFAPALQAAVHARAELEQDLRQAIMNNQFVLYYQPQVERERVTGAEALMRWNHPRQGVLLPEKFISLAEETGLILPLGNWALETACAQIVAWKGRKESAHLAMAVNISAQQFRQPDFVEQVLEALQRTGANAQNLRLELTESMLLENIEDVIAKMTRLRSHGLRFSLDDFGTGYSSLAYLKRLPLDQLKIDWAFVRDILADTTSGAIAQTIISLGQVMGLSVIAEGVETVEQRDFLIGLGCHSFQGYLLGRPLPLEEFEQRWLPSRRTLKPRPDKPKKTR